MIGGSGRLLLDGDVVELRQWDLVRVAPEVTRAFAAGPDGLEIVAVGGPKPEGGDGEPGPADWPRRASRRPPPPWLRHGACRSARPPTRGRR